MSAGTGRVDAPDRLRVILDLVEQSLDEPTLDGSSWPTGRTCPGSSSIAWSPRLGEPPGTFRRRLLFEGAAHRLATTLATA